MRGGVFLTLQAMVEAAATACRIRSVKIWVFADHITRLSGVAVHGCRIASRSIYADSGASFSQGLLQWHMTSLATAEAEGEEESVFCKREPYAKKE